MNLQRKLLLAFGLVLIFTLGVAGSGLWLNHRALGAFERTFQEDVVHERTVAQLQSHFKTQVQEWKDVLLRGMDPSLLDKHWNAFVQQERWVHEHALELGQSLSDPAERELIGRFVSAHDTMARSYRDGREKFLAAGLDSSVGDTAVRGVDRVPSQLLEELAAHIGSVGRSNAEQAYSLGSDAARWSMGLLVLATFCGMAIAWVLSRSIARPIHEAIGVAGRVAEGDLSRAIIARGRDEVAQLLHSLAHMQERLSGMVHQVRGGAESVASASAQIAHGNNDLSQRTEEQASALQQTAATMEQLGTTVQRSANNARDADDLARSASSVAERGGSAVERVVETMSGIQQSSRRIADIIGVIDGIAFQTNILALNAAVEAARAGEQGRGFAVVASEVRALAQRSASAAREIKSLITESVTRVEEGNVLASEAGSTMEEVVTAIRRVSQIVGDISGAVGEQRLGIEQITTAINQMDTVTQQNAALVEESAAAAESLRIQARGLVGSVDVFRLAHAA